MTCASQHFTHKRLRLEQLSRHCRIYPDLASQKELDLVRLVPAKASALQRSISRLLVSFNETVAKAASAVHLDAYLLICNGQPNCQGLYK